MRDREKQRELHRQQVKQKEEAIDRRNYYGFKDLTAYNAVLQIRTNGEAPIVLK